MKSILIVDDEPEIVSLYKKIMTRVGYNARGALGGEECLEMIKSQMPDLILLDVMMPRMDGFEVCKRIKETYTENLPFIYMFSNKKNDTDTTKAILYSNADGFISKTIKITELVEFLKELFKHKEERPLKISK